MPLHTHVTDELIRRVKSEFMEMPGLRLTVLQAKRLWALSHDDCECVLQALVEHRFLILGTDGKFGRLSDPMGAVPAPRPAKAGLDGSPGIRRIQQTG